ncbi:MAG: tRNA (adenosine(37)-N6)-dimethylallyltransferase MiaA, partial [Spirochaetia bacterium]|nr:tRNA (adenosine(37)-N6)-dimethylallyltransferase MiaA [Spirochaetia bacterium]
MKKKTSSSKIPVIVIFAPTASGKTALTGDLFSPSGSHFVLNAEVISADSMQVYKYMDIGTAKADPEFCEKIPHHLINLVTPDVQFTVADFLKMADEKCEEIYTRGKLPVVVGGTGFYIRSFLFGLPETPESDENLRNQLKSRIETEGNEILYKELHSVDPESASKIHVNDAYRIVRALEVFYTTGKKRSDFIVEKNLRDKFDFLFIVLQPPRELLYERIRNRVDVMFQQGLVQEFNSLVERGYSKDTPGMKAIGYSEFFEYEDIETVKDRIKHDSCKYAKKQYTYI